MIYQVNMERFSVEHQAESWLCWAATVKAIASYNKRGNPDQKGLERIYKDKTEGNDPTKVLSERYNLKSSSLIGWREKAKSGDMEKRKSELRETLKDNLSEASGPLLCGLTEANDTKWMITVKNSKKPYVFKHATLIFKFDEASDLVYFADPARPPERGRYVAFSVSDLVKGFDYIKVSDIGPKASKIVPSGLSDIRVRLFKLIKYNSDGC